jgi:hypothetical protein
MIHSFIHAWIAIASFFSFPTTEKKYWEFVRFRGFTSSSRNASGMGALI